MNLIEKLKDKNYVRAFGLMTPDEQECFRKVGYKNCNWYSDEWKDKDVDLFYNQSTYAIKPDYQPEYVDLEIVKNGQWLGVWITSSEFVKLHELPSLPNFVEFNIEKTRNIFIGDVANERVKGKQVYARFRSNQNG